MKLTRWQFTAGLATAALDPAALIRPLAERLDARSGRLRAADAPVEQHLVPGLRVVFDQGVAVIVPPLHHRVVTARVTIPETARALQDARTALEGALRRVETRHAISASGVCVTVAWGLPYFRRFVPARADRAIPIDLRASVARGREVRVLEEAARFPSDPETTILEQNDLAVLLRSDDVEAIDDAQAQLFGELGGLFAITSIRNGFVGGGRPSRASLPKTMAMRARIRGAAHIPRQAELFLGFTSTARHALGPGKIANFETLGYARLASPYFVGGTHMHLSHLFEDVNAWYLNFDRGERVGAMFRPGLRIEGTRLTVDQSADDVETVASIRAGYARHGRIGHAGAIQSASRLTADIVGPDGTRYAKGTAVPQRADFNTLDNPFAWSASATRDRVRDEPAEGVHFVVFNPTGDDFRRVRLAMDGVLPGGVRLPFEPRAFGQGINAVFHATHRQNFLVPPRAHRSFPLSELRS